MLFPYQSIENHQQVNFTTNEMIAFVKTQKEQLKQFELAQFNHFSVYELMANRTMFYDCLLTDMWRYFGLDSYENLTLIAVGGYGRKEMFPLSDLDVLILREQALNEKCSVKISEFVQCLWDCGFEVGQAVRTLQECEDVGRTDITIATNLLEARYLYGSNTQFEQLTALVKQPDFWAREAFFQAKTEERVARYQRYHNTSYNLEPDIKYSPGGLRDLHLLYWIALRHNGAKTLEDILNSGFIYPQEYELLQDGQQFLFKVRFALHLIIKPYDNRLLFERQIRVAELLGFNGQGNEGVEQMMKRFFQALQSISLLSDLIVKHYREHFLQINQNVQVEILDSYFELRNQAICLRSPNVLQEFPEQILDLFLHLIQLPQSEIHSSTLRQLHLALDQLEGYLCEIPVAREKFLRLFNKPNAIARAFVLMHKYGVLTAYLPQWKNIEGLMQFDLFHCYTVDEHILRTMGKLEFFLQPESANIHPLCSQIFPRIGDRALLYIAALFHDIAKGRGGEHAILGAQDVRTFALQHGFDRREVETLAWLVEQHLLMSVTAQRRDIHDPEVVLRFAEKVKNKVRLDYLTCLTVADICATNETLWNSWKGSLINTLYEFTNKQFVRGMDVLLDHQDQIDAHREQASALLLKQDLNLSSSQIENIWHRFPAEYFLRNRPKQIAWHTSLLAQNEGQTLVKISNRFSEGGTEVFIYCSDQSNLFRKVVTTIGAKKFSIHEAQIITSNEGYVFDTFIITELDGSLVRFERRRSLEQALIQVLNKNNVPALNIQNNHKLQHFSVKTEIQFFNEHRIEQTEMELSTLDQAGLLAKVSEVFSELRLNILNAKITTNGEKAEDFFILVNEQDQALNAEQRMQLTQRLREMLAPMS
ncbi:bifunctional uridylyltransferase/uridylyl-removing protein GlnD [[Haemophilus] felis]|uniref:Bifunctional uridylyltransferase/uridylyl-removing enzyme n=1 Tax=[Haemophilus] felis TaxID=123822 RepID=A0A1T0AWB3_9PAST|nr:bifunctional uridylyltransferase/uridylyl-removing protein GlnD [[Haemophilus] felis]OOS01153.1 [protein-PII] uridylyltransferase [[Haemophilus] felis]